MAILAGEIVAAGRLMRLQTRTYTVRASSSLTLSATETDIPGCSYTLTTEAAAATFEVVAAFDCFVSVTNATTLMEGRLTVDSVLQLGRATHGMDTADRDSVAGVWSGTLASAGSHTFTLRGAKTDSNGTGAIQGTNTAMTIRITEVA